MAVSLHPWYSQKLFLLMSLPIFIKTTISAHLSICLLLVSTSPLLGQDDYFQQEVNFSIQVELDDQLHQLRGQWSMDYHNNSPDTLAFIYLHLWPNAYQNRSTAFAQQELASGDVDFYFAPEEDLGFIDSLNFSCHNTSLTVLPTELGPDVVKVVLNEPLLPKGDIRIESPFRLQFPASFSRLGHVGQSYQVTQWYPKPAVYDQEGWHPMAYLDYGEYYSEFGSYDVSLTLPANYLVGATGELKTKEEQTWLIDRARATAQKIWSDNDPAVYTSPAFPASMPEQKTLHFEASWVHDFAWFADKRFHVLHDSVSVIGKTQPIKVWSFFTDEQAHLWQNSLEYLKRSTVFYSQHIGSYPYPQVTAVQSALSAGGGMEYPMITVIGLAADGRALDNVLTHEVGHNWFYGILASNERTHSWMDEGFNSYYDQRYDHQYYGSDTLLPKVMSGNTSTNLDEIGYRYYACQRLTQAPDTPSEQLEFYNYWVGSYGTPAKALRQLEGYWGKERFDQAMQAYFRKWQFKHPRPQDVQTVLEKEGDDDLSWLFQGFMQSVEQQDYELQKLVKGEQPQLNLTNKGNIAGPFSLQTIDSNGDTTLNWQPGFIGDKQIGLANKKYDQLLIDPTHHSLEAYRQNNNWQKGWGKLAPPQLRLLTGIKSDTKSTLFALPLVGYNEDDGVLSGLVLHNRGIIPQTIEWVAAPFYGFQSKSLNGMLGLQLRIKQAANSTFREIKLFSNLRSFHFATYEPEEFPLSFQRGVAGFSLTFHELPNSKWVPSATTRGLYINKEELNFSTDGVFLGTKDQLQDIYQVSFEMDRDWVLSPAHLRLTYEHANYTDDFSRDQMHNKLILEGKGKFLYQAQKAFHWRLFAGFFLSNSLQTTTYTPAQAFSLFDRGADDYRFDNAYLGRTATDGITSQQLGLRAGGFRAPVPTAFQVGRSNKRMISVNTSIDLPFTPSWLPLRPYLDAGSYVAPTFNGDENKFLWTGGLAIEWLDGKIGIYAPLFGSPEIINPLKEQGGLGERIAFRLLLTELAPWKWADGLRGW